MIPVFYESVVLSFFFFSEIQSAVCLIYFHVQLIINLLGASCSAYYRCTYIFVFHVQLITVLRIIFLEFHVQLITAAPTSSFFFMCTLSQFHLTVHLLFSYTAYDNFTYFFALSQSSC